MLRKRARVEPGAWASGYSPDVLAEIEELYNKSFTFQKPARERWVLPQACEAFPGGPQPQPDPPLQALKLSLNEVKNQLSDKDLEKWHEHTAFTNRARGVAAHVRQAANAELCTQAWCKFHEILVRFELLPVGALWQAELNSVHLCEAPGAFIASLNHHLRAHKIPCAWSWVGNTLNPYHEANDTGTMITDDRLIASTLPWWYFGPDNTGDVMAPAYLTGLKKFTSNMAEIHLVTADGSFDCQDNPGEQESLVASLHYCEAVTALTLLSPRGSLVLKMFTLLEHSSLCLLYLLNCCFRQVHVLKPGTSKAGNSEVYVVCLYYAGPQFLGALLPRLTQRFGPDVAREALLPRSLIPDSFLEQQRECCTFFHRLQTDAIGENLRLFGNLSAERCRGLEELHHCAAESFLHRFCVRRLARADWVLRGPGARHSLHTRLFCQRSRKHSGTYNQRREWAALSWAQRVQRGDLAHWVEEHTLGQAGAEWERGHSLEGPAEEAGCQAWYLLEGLRLPVVTSSPFCEVGLLRALREAMAQGLAGAGRESLACASCALVTRQAMVGRLAQLAQEWVRGDAKPGASPEQCAGTPCEAIDCPAELCSTLHDADPRYQLWLLDAVQWELRSCPPGGTVAIPILSAFTRLTAGLVYVLHQCFRAVSFACPTSHHPLGTLAVLLCAGFAPPLPGVSEFLGELRQRVAELLDSPQQVLQFVPVETLLEGGLPEFLCALNTAIARHRLHLLIRAFSPGAAAR
eukprot:gi/632989170/ref/XP_007883504.1/ PREDICTED: cap-specific mRNA (nucleoside-2'-O-)-methyltransferase 2 [Callorhinchus milii]